MSRQLTNGPARTLRCPKHSEMSVVLFGQPSAVAWCKCGSPMTDGRKSRSSSKKIKKKGK